MAATIHFEFEIDQLVTIAGSGLVGKVVGLWVDLEGTERTNVEWYDKDGGIHYHWFKGNEIVAY